MGYFIICYITLNILAQGGIHYIVHCVCFLMFQTFFLGQFTVQTCCVLLDGSAFQVFLGMDIS